METYETSTQPFSTGMYLRVPYEDRPDDQDYRDYRIGQVVGMNDDTGRVIVRLEVHEPHVPPFYECREFAYRVVERCHLAMDVPFTYTPTNERGRVLIACDNTFCDGQYSEYYVQLHGTTLRISEADMVVSFTAMDVDPRKQLQRYELHNPVWRSMRDDIVESYCQLKNATFGIEDLVGSRVMLLPHQAEVIARVLGDPTCRYILADEVGLGKTIEASVILKGLRRRNPTLNTLIVTPASLLQQWKNELASKFWLRFEHVADACAPDRVDGSPGLSSSGMLVSTEDVETSARVWNRIREQHWDLLIVDEAHQLWKTPTLYNRIHTLSQTAERALILSATPIQRRKEEYLALLKLMDPKRYDLLDTDAFQRILVSQDRIRRTTAYVARSLTDEDFEPQEFADEMGGLSEHGADPVLAALVAHTERQTESSDRGLAAAKEVVAYVSENYRIESRVIRNRRLHLTAPLPVRALDVSYAYTPASEELAMHAAVYEYVDYALRTDPSPVRTEFMRVMLHAGASSAAALLTLIEQRIQALQTTSTFQLRVSTNVISPASPRQEANRLALLNATLVPLNEEQAYLDQILWTARDWQDCTTKELDSARARPFAIQPEAQHRLVQVVRALHTIMNTEDTRKVLVFSSWPQTIELLAACCLRLFGKSCVAQFTTGQEAKHLQQEADRFQSDTTCRILLCDELGGEGRNFQIADTIIHVDLPWTPAQIEQRIGRVDRLGRSGTVTSVIPYAEGGLEHQLFDIWQDAFQLFTQSMSGMEIALEGVQNDLADGLRTGVWQGLGDLRASMIDRAIQIRAEVEEERYFEEGAINHRRRREFQGVSERYQDGGLLRGAFLKWANVAGLRHSYNRYNDIVRFNPDDFSLASMKNAKFVDVPDMTEALTYSGRLRNLVINGTFNRDVAVQREDLVFFAPGNDSWIDTIMRNAQGADNGRCCAISRFASELEGRWDGFELHYSLSVDPRPLYALGQDPSHLLRAQGFLTVPTVRLLITTDGTVERRSLIRDIIKPRWDKKQDPHLGQRSGSPSLLSVLKRYYPPNDWQLVVNRILGVAEQTLDEELDFTPGLAEEALEELERQVAGFRASQRWLARSDGLGLDIAEHDMPEQIVAALVQGIRQPIRRLESICFWMLHGGK